MSSHTIADDSTNNIMKLPNPPTRKGIYFMSVFVRSFNRAGGLGLSPLYSSPEWFWEIREHGPPPDDITAHAGDIYLDISTVPVGVYQNTSTGWISCWSEPPSVNQFSKKREFYKLPHPLFKDRFLWTTKIVGNVESLSLSYITHEELNTRGGTEEDKQVYLLQDLKTFNPSITTAETLAARKEAARLEWAGIQAGKSTWLDSSSSSSTTDVGDDSDGMSVEELEDLCDDDSDNMLFDVLTNNFIDSMSITSR